MRAPTGETGRRGDDSGGRRLFAGAGAALASVILLSGAPGALADSSRDDRIAAVLEQQVDRGAVVGVAALVEVRGEVYHHSFAGLRDREHELPMVADAIFPVDAMATPVFAVAALLLEERGRLSLSDPVAKYLPKLASLRVQQSGDESPERAVTLRDLLTHSSGIPTIRVVPRKRRGATAQPAPRLQTPRLAFTPGSRWSYRQSTDVMARVLEAAAGMPLDQFLKRQLFWRLGMRETGFDVPQKMRGRIVRTYKQTNTARLKRIRIKPGRSSPRDGAALYTTMQDMHRFLRMLLAGGELDGVRVLKAESVRQMLRDTLGDRPTPRLLGGHGQGLGVAIVRSESAVEDGMSAGSFFWGGRAGTCFWVDPARQLIGLYLTRRIPQYGVAREFQAAVYGALRATGG